MSKQKNLIEASQNVTFDTSGNVGIGTDFPEYLLHLKGPLPYIAFEDTDNGATSKHSITGNSDGNVYFDSVANSASGNSGFRFRQNAAATTSLSIDSAGRVTMPYQPHIHGSPVNSTGAGAANSFATGYSKNTLSFSNGRVTVPIDGIYLILFNSIADTGTGRLDIFIKVNGTIATSSLSNDSDSGFRQNNCSAVLNLSANDYITFEHEDWYNFGGTSYDNWRTASVTLIG